MGNLDLISSSKEFRPAQDSQPSPVVSYLVEEKEFRRHWMDPLATIVFYFIFSCLAAHDLLPVPSTSTMTSDEFDGYVNNGTEQHIHLIMHDGDDDIQVVDRITSARSCR